MKNVELKIKLKSLAAEAKIIRREENKLRNAEDRLKAIEFLTSTPPAHSTAERIALRSQRALARLKIMNRTDLTEAQKARVAKRLEVSHRRQDLVSHRKVVVGVEARHSYLAYAFLRGVPLKTVEAKSYVKPEWSRVEKMVKRFSKDFANDQEIKQKLEEWIQSAA